MGSAEGAANKWRHIFQYAYNEGYGGGYVNSRHGGREGTMQNKGYEMGKADKAAKRPSDWKSAYERRNSKEAK